MDKKMTYEEAKDALINVLLRKDTQFVYDTDTLSNSDKYKIYIGSHERKDFTIYKTLDNTITLCCDFYNYLNKRDFKKYVLNNQYLLEKLNEARERYFKYKQEKELEDNYKVLQLLCSGKIED